jgi:hypothetical protein
VREVVEVGQVGDGGRPDTTTLFAPGPDGRVGPRHTLSAQLRARLADVGLTVYDRPAVVNTAATDTLAGYGIREVPR